jgi:hypothetical protein
MALAHGPVDPAIFAQLAEVARRDDTYVLIHVGRAIHGDPSLAAPGSLARIAAADLAIIRGRVVKANDPELIGALAAGAS